MRSPSVNKRTKESGFSLIELMITVAILGILSSFAIPELQRFQAKAKQAEALGNLNLIADLELSYFGVYDVYCGNGGYQSDVPCVGFQMSGHARYLYYVQITINPDGELYDFVALAAATSNNVIVPQCSQLDTWYTCAGKELYPIHDCSTL